MRERHCVYKEKGVRERETEREISRWRASDENHCLRFPQQEMVKQLDSSASVGVCVCVSEDVCVSVGRRVCGVSL